MRIWLQLFVCVAGGTIAVLVGPSFWMSIRMEVLTFLSVLLAAVLFRLGRGIPDLAWEGADSDRVRRIAGSFKIVGDRLAYMFGVVAGAVLWLILIEPLHASFCHSPRITQGLAWITGFLVFFSLVRAVVLVSGDRNLISLQVDLVERIAHRQDVSEEKKRLDAAEHDRPLRPPDGYGGLHKST